MVKDFAKLAREIIAQNEYLTLATVRGEGGQVWAAVVAYAFDKDYNLYFLSMPTSQHSKNIAENSHVSCTIFDSRQKFGCGVGLQMQDIVRRVSLAELPKAMAVYFKRKYPYGSVSGWVLVPGRKVSSR